MSTATSPDTRLRWGAAFEALDRLMRDKDDTVAVFDIMRALDGRAPERGARRLLRERGQAWIDSEPAPLAPWLAEAARQSWPEGSVGAAYRGFVERTGLTAKGLVEVSLIGSAQDEEARETPAAHFGRRIRDTHDLWHVMTGYGTDGSGESCVVAFSYAQLGGLGWALIALGTALVAALARRFDVVRAVWEGWRLGRRAHWLPAEPTAELMMEPLENVRLRMRIGTPRAYLSIPPSRR